MDLIAVTRGVSPGIARCELTHLPRTPIDVARARAQHRAYEEALAAAGCAVQSLPAEPDLPDAVFVEDAAVVLEEIAILTRPGAASRRAEVASVGEALASHRPLARIEEPGTLEGGDVLRVGRDVFVGLSSRTNREGVAQLRAIAGPFGYAVTPVEVRGCLHLKSAATAVAPDTLLAHPGWVDTTSFGGRKVLRVHESEPYGANALPVGAVVFYSEAFPRTAAMLEREGIALRRLDVSELQKAEGALTCCSLVFAAESRGA